jgi:hypothetical protein
MADLLEIGLDSTPACPAGRVAIREGRHQRQELLVGEIRIARICRQDIFRWRSSSRPQGFGGEADTKAFEGGARRSLLLRRDLGAGRSGHCGEGKCYRGIP